jgi:hypothetical protein
LRLVGLAPFDHFGSFGPLGDRRRRMMWHFINLGNCCEQRTAYGTWSYRGGPSTLGGNFYNCVCAERIISRVDLGLNWPGWAQIQDTCFDEGVLGGRAKFMQDLTA